MQKRSHVAGIVGFAVLAAIVLLRSIDGNATQATSSAHSSQSGVDEVWAREDAYWRFVKAGDVDNYLKLWNTNFRGWPCATEHPATKTTIGDWVREIRDNKIRFSYDLMREGAANVNGTVVVYYRTPMVYQYSDGRTEGAGLTRKFTHTWMKVDGTWQIIGGMCGADAPRA
jgi:hypothetical protein